MSLTYSWMGRHYESWTVRQRYLNGRRTTGMIEDALNNGRARL